MNLKKFTQKNADGSSISYEFDVPKMQGIPDHPGDPKGTDTVPAWLTPGEFVMNAEATRMFEPQIEAMNNAGRAVQRQQGGTIPEYKAEGGDVVPPGYTDEDVALEGYLNSIPLVPERPQELTDQLNQTNPNLVPQEVDITNAVSMSPVGLIADEVSSKDYQTPYDPRINPNRVQVPVQREDRSLLETLFGPAGALFPFGYTDKKEAEEDLVTLKTQRENAVKTGNVDLVPEIDAEIDKQQSIIDSSDNYNQEVKTARATNTARDLNDKIKQVTYSDATVEDKRTALLGLGLDPEEVNQILEDKSENNDTVIEVTKRKEQEAVVNSKAQDVDNAVKKTEGESNPGTDDVSTGKVIKTGEETIKTDPDMWDKAMSFIGDAFDEILDTKSLTQAALLYLGSRALGYSHGGSLNYVGKAYAQQIGNKLKAADKASLSNKFTKESVEKYRKTGNVSDLKAMSSWSDDKTNIYVNNAGKTFNVVSQKSADGKIRHINVDTGQPIDIRKLELNQDRTARVASNSKRSAGIADAEYKARIPKDDQDSIRARLPTPEAIGNATSTKFIEMGLNPAQANKIIADITREMINDVNADPNSDKVITEASLIPYVNKRIMTMSLEQQGLAKELAGVTPEALATTLDLNINQEDPVAVQKEIQDLAKLWKSLNAKGKEYYNNRRTEGMPPILVLLDEVNKDKANEGFFKVKE